MVFGYYIFEVFVLGYEWRVGLIDAAANLAQAAIGGVIFVPFPIRRPGLKDIDNEKAIVLY